MILTAGRNETFSFARSIGVGLIQSAINLTEICYKEKPEKLIFVGSAGSYGKIDIFSVVESKISVNVEIGNLSKKSYSPLKNIVKNVSRETMNDVIVNSSNYITSSQDEAELFLKAGYDLENMEFFSVLSVAEKFNIPAFGIFVVSNFCNTNAHQDFVSNHTKAMQILEKYIKTRANI